mgnify:CR=1 FL=1
MSTRSRAKRATLPSPDDTSAAETTDANELRRDLEPELALVRQVMRRLVHLWDMQGDAIDPEEARRLAGLIFNGARTAAILLYRPPRTDKKDEDKRWLTNALDSLGEQWQVEI